jgi:hypothetical protein
MKMGKYLAVYRPEHPRSTKEGVVYEHVLVAEEAIGRILKPSEIVHHIDLNKLNNSPSNLMVLDSNADHMRFHSYGCDAKMLTPTGDGAYLCRKKHEDTIGTVCPVCDGVKYARSKMCATCRKSQNSLFIPTANELRHALDEANWNFCAVGRLYAVSYSAVKKWCKKYGLPHNHSSLKKCLGKA